MSAKVMIASEIADMASRQAEVPEERMNKG